MLWFSDNSVHANPPNRLQVNSAVINMEDSENLIFFIEGLNFGDAPQVSLGNYPLVVVPGNSLNDHIEATFEGDIPPGTYRLSVARSGFDFSHPEKADSLDVTISNANSDTNSGALERGNIYEIYETTGVITKHDGATPITIQCFCLGENDIALNGGYEIITDSFPESELTILESNMHYIEDQGENYYKLVVNNPTEFGSDDRMWIKIDAYLRCIGHPESR